MALGGEGETIENAADRRYHSWLDGRNLRRRPGAPRWRRPAHLLGESTLPPRRRQRSRPASPPAWRFDDDIWTRSEGDGDSACGRRRRRRANAGDGASGARQPGAGHAHRRPGHHHRHPGGASRTPLPGVARVSHRARDRRASARRSRCPTSRAGSSTITPIGATRNRLWCSTARRCGDRTAARSWSSCKTTWTSSRTPASASTASATTARTSSWPLPSSTT